MTTATNATNGFDGFDLRIMMAQMHAKIMEDLKMGAARASEDVAEGVRKGAKWAGENVTAENAKIGAQWAADQSKRGAKLLAEGVKTDLNMAASIMQALWNMLSNLFRKLAQMLGYVLHGPSKLTPKQVVGEEPVKTSLAAGAITPTTLIPRMSQDTPQQPVNANFLALSGPQGVTPSPVDAAFASDEGLAPDETPLAEEAGDNPAPLMPEVSPDIAKGVILGEATKIMDHFVATTDFSQLRGGSESEIIHDFASMQIKPLSELARVYSEKANAAEKLLDESIMEKAASVGSGRNFKSIKEVLLREDTGMAQLLVGDGWKDLHEQNEAITRLRAAANRAALAASTLVETAERLAQENPSPELTFSAKEIKAEFETLFATGGAPETTVDNSQLNSFTLDGIVAQSTKAQTILNGSASVVEGAVDQELDPLVEQEAVKSPLLSGDVFRFQDGKMSRQPVPEMDRLRTIFESGRDTGDVVGVVDVESREIKDGQRQG